jgi:hypothetical protein
VPTSWSAAEIGRRARAAGPTRPQPASAAWPHHVERLLDRFRMRRSCRARGPAAAVATSIAANVEAWVSWFRGGRKPTKPAAELRAHRAELVAAATAQRQWERDHRR